jgi:hypothetical protein
MERKPKMYELPKFNLVSFADNRMKRSLNRLNQQASQFSEIDQCFLFSEDDLSIEFKRKMGGRLDKDVRGFGYWAWKPEVVLMAMDRVDFGDLVCYCDAGFHLNFSGAEHLQRYLTPLLNNEADLVAFSHDINLVNFDSDRVGLPDLSENKYTKGDMFDHWSIRKNRKYTHSSQFAGGLFFMKKTPETIRMLNEWRDTALNKPQLFDDSQSSAPNFSGFIENRHDQSYFSLLCKTSNHRAFSAFEFWYPRGPKLALDWEIIADYPFHAKRDKQFSGHRRFWQPLFMKYLAIRRKLKSL